MSDADCSDPQIVGGDADPLLSPLLVARLRLRSVREKTNALKIPERLFEKLICAYAIDVCFLGFGLANDTQPTPQNFFDYDNRHCLFQWRSEVGRQIAQLLANRKAITAARRIAVPVVSLL